MAFDNERKGYIELEVTGDTVRSDEQEAVFQYLHMLLFSARLPEEIPAAIRDDSKAEEIIQTLMELRSALKMASRGDFSYKISLKGFMGGALKALQANLNHIAWLTSRLADGDFGQRIDFMGDLSTAFNAMTERLAQTLQELKEKQERLEALAVELQEEIDHRKNIEESLRLEKERWSLAVQCSHDGIWDIDLENPDSAPYCSPRFLSMTGITAENLLRKEDWRRLLHPDDTEALAFLDEVFTADRIPPSFSLDHRLLCSDGRYRWFMTQGMLLFHPVTNAPSRLIGVTSDIQERKTREEEAAYQATHDPLTGLPNRLLFEEYVKHSISSVKRNNTCMGLILLDLDNFKTVNDTMGHEAGDTVLVTVAGRLKQSIRESDIACRLGGDEFVLLLVFKDADDPNIETVALRILNALRQTIWIGSKPVRITASMGISLCPTDGDEQQQLLRRADEAMYFIKDSGRNLCALWRPGGLHQVLPDASLRDFQDKAESQRPGSGKVC